MVIKITALLRQWDFVWVSSSYALSVQSIFSHQKWTSVPGGGGGGGDSLTSRLLERECYLESATWGIRHYLGSQNSRSQMCYMLSEIWDGQDHLGSNIAIIFHCSSHLFSVKIFLETGQLIIWSLWKSCFDYLGVWENCATLAPPFQKPRSPPWTSVPCAFSREAWIILILFMLNRFTWDWIT